MLRPLIRATIRKISVMQNERQKSEKNLTFDYKDYGDFEKTWLDIQFTM